MQERKDKGKDFVPGEGDRFPGREEFSLHETDFGELNNRPKKLSGAVLVYGLEGGAEFMIDITTYRVTAGDLVLLLPGTIVARGTTVSSPRFVFIYMSEDFFGRVAYNLPSEFFLLP